MAACRWGITQSLDQVFEAEPIIKRVMNDEAFITRAFIGPQCVARLLSLFLPIIMVSVYRVYVQDIP